MSTYNRGEIFWVTEPVGPDAFQRPGVYVAASETPGYGALMAAIAAGVGEDLGQRESLNVIVYRADVMEDPETGDALYEAGHEIFRGPLNYAIFDLQRNGYSIVVEDVRQALVDDDEQEFYFDDGATALVIQAAGLVELRAMHVIDPRASNPEGEAIRNLTFEFGQEFFINKRRQYGDWRSGWWREAIQNSVDAGAKTVRCEVRRREDGNFDVSVEDDGHGMTEDVLVNKFLRGGGTTKVGAAGATGGFGSAKELLLLPWLGYTIETGDLIARGVMQNITIERAAEPRKSGVKLTVVMAADDYTPAHHAVGFILKCFLPRVKFYVYDEDSGEREIQARLRTGKPVDEIDGVATLYAPKVDYNVSRLYVRVKGLFMFERWVSGASNLRRQPIVEITAPSVDVLTDNRDGFRTDTDLQARVDQIVSNIAVEAERAFRKKSGLLREIYEGTGKYRVEIRRREARVMQQMGSVIPVRPKPGSGGPQVVLRPENVEQIARELEEDRRITNNDQIPNGDLAKALINNVSFQGPTHVSRALKQLVWEPDFYLMNEAEGYRVPKKFRPETMGSRIYKLVKVWGELCRFVLMQLDSEEEYGIGFVFSTDALAMYTREQGQNWLLLRPFKSFTRSYFGDKPDEGPIYKPSSVEDLKLLYALAIHEVTHMSDGVIDHNVEFAYALTKNIALTADGFKQVRKIARSIKMADRPNLRSSVVIG